MAPQPASLFSRPMPTSKADRSSSPRRTRMSSPRQLRPSSAPWPAPSPRGLGAASGRFVAGRDGIGGDRLVALPVGGGDERRAQHGEQTGRGGGVEQDVGGAERAE